jgi:hypothetical protein
MTNELKWVLLNRKYVSRSVGGWFENGKHCSYINDKVLKGVQI